MKPKTKNNIQLTLSVFGLFTSFAGVALSNHWIVWAFLFVAFLVVTFIVLDRRENLRKGWRV